MTNPRNLPTDPIKAVEDLLKNFEAELVSQHPDYEALVFTSARIQRVALVAIAGPSILTGDIEQPRAASMNSLAMQKLAHRALQAVGRMEDYLGEAWMSEGDLGNADETP